MIKNPYTNAFIASGYIAGIVLTINKLEKLKVIEDALLLPVVMISLLVFSVALMAVLFFYQPLHLFLENQRGEALKFFFKTISTFALTTIVLFSILIYISVLN